MSSIATSKNEVILYYNSKTALGKQTLAYVESASKSINSIDISKTKVTGTQWTALAEALQLTIAELINTDHPNFKQNYKTIPSLSQDDWIKVLTSSPETLKCPILFTGKDFHFVETPSMVANLLKIEGEDIDSRHPN